MKKKFSRGFTLIELLVVITIIGILASLAIPGISMAMQAAKKAEAKTFMSGLATAMVNYRTEYNTVPPFVPTASGVLETDAHWKDFYAVMVYPNEITYDVATKGNSRKIQFMTVPAKYLVLKDGSDLTSANNYFVDPWERMYKMWVDTDYDNILEGLPNLKNGAAESASYKVPGDVAVWSAAADTAPSNDAERKKSIGTWK